MGGFAPSLAALGESARARPDDPQAWLDFGIALFHAGHGEHALQSLKHALNLGRDDPAVLTRAGETFERVGALPEALAAGRRASQLPEGSAAAAALVGRVLTRMGDAPAAALTLRVAIARHPDSAPLHIALGHALIASDRPLDAVVHTERAVFLAPDEPAAHRLSALLHERLGDQDAYIDALGRVAALDESDVSSAVALGTQMAKLGRRTEAVDLLVNASARGAKTPPAHLALGTGFLEARALAAAVRHLKEAIRLQPDLAAAHLQLGIAFRQAGSLPDAVAALRKATLLAPDNSHYHYQLGLALLEAGQSREAANVLIRAAAFDPDDENTQDALARALNETRKPQPELPEPVEESDRATATFSGDLRLFSVAELLDFLHNQRATGTLIVRGAKGEGRVELYLGSIVGARYPGSKPLSRQLLDIDLIGQTDLKRAVVDPEDLDRDAVVANVLASRNLVDKGLLEDRVYRHVQDALQEMLTWQTGDAVFRREGDSTVWTESPEIRLDTRLLLLEATRRIDERNSQSGKKAHDRS